MKKKKRKKPPNALAVLDLLQKMKGKMRAPHALVVPIKYQESVDTQPAAVIIRDKPQSDRVRAIFAGAAYLKPVEGGVVKAKAPTDGLLVASPAGDIYLSEQDVVGALRWLGLRVVEVTPE